MYDLLYIYNILFDSWLYIHNVLFHAQIVCIVLVSICYSTMYLSAPTVQNIIYCGTFLHMKQFIETMEHTFVRLEHLFLIHLQDISSL